MFNSGAKGYPSDASTVAAVEVPTAASQTEMEAASNTAKFVTPGTEKYHPGVSKAWAHVTWSGGVPSLTAGHNVSSSVTDTGTGNFTITFTAALSSAFYAVIVTPIHSSAPRVARVTSQSTTAIAFQINDSAFNAADPEAVNIVVFGDFA